MKISSANKNCNFQSCVGFLFYADDKCPNWGGEAIDAHINCCLLEKGTFQKLLNGFFPLRGVKYLWVGWG